MRVWTGRCGPRESRISDRVEPECFNRRQSRCHVHILCEDIMWRVLSLLLLRYRMRRNCPSLRISNRELPKSLEHSLPRLRNRQGNIIPTSSYSSSLQQELSHTRYSSTDGSLAGNALLQLWGCLSRRQSRCYRTEPRRRFTQIKSAAMALAQIWRRMLIRRDLDSLSRQDRFSQSRRRAQPQ